jgi:hypothetical protein
MAQISRSTKIGGGTVFQSNTVARAADVETDMAAVFAAHNNHDTGTSEWQRVLATNASNPPIVANNSTGTNNIFEAHDNGSAVFSIEDGGTVSVDPGGTNKVTMNSSGMTLANSATIAMGSAKITGLANGTAATDAMAFGQRSILQVVSATSTTNFSTTSSSFQDTNLSASITPTSASNDVLILVTGNLRVGAAAVSAYVTIERGSTNLAGSNGFAKNEAASATGALDAPCSIVYLDSPATTSATTYTVQIKNDNGSTTVEWPSESTTMTQSIILIEVAG